MRLKEYDMRLKLICTLSLLFFSCAKDQTPEHPIAFSSKNPLTDERFDLPDVIQKPFMTMLGHQKDWYHGIDKRLLDAVHVFEERTGDRVDIPVVVSPIREKYGKSLAGVCIQVNDVNYKAVVIDEEWYNAHENRSSMIEHAVLHELGHCLLGYGHDDEMMWKDGVEVPASIMNSYTWSSNLMSYYEDYKSLYFERYFR